MKHKGKNGQNKTESGSPSQNAQIKKDAETLSKLVVEAVKPSGSAFQKDYKRPSNEAIIAALGKSAGTIAAAALALGVSRRSLYNWINDDPELADEMWHARETIADVAQMGLAAKVIKGESEIMIMYALNNLRKDIFSTRTEIDTRTTFRVIIEGEEPEKTIDVPHTTQNRKDKH